MNAMKEKKGVLTVVLTGFEDEETVRFLRYMTRFCSRFTR
jgi:hypothetical protein